MEAGTSYKGEISKHGLDGLRKAETQLKPRRSRDAKGNKKSFYNHIGNTSLKKESVSLLLNGVWDLVTVHTGKAEVLSVAFASVGLPAPVISERGQQEELPSVDED